MGGGIWERKMILRLTAIVLLGVLALPVSAGTTIPVQAVLVTDCPPTRCATDAGKWYPWAPFGGFWNFVDWGTYSLLGVPPALANGGTAYAGFDPGVPTVDNKDGVYVPGTGVQSEILTHNTVYTLDTLDTLNQVTGAVIDGVTITATLHFYNHVGNMPPGCWGTPTLIPYTGDDGKIHNIVTIDVTQAVNWSILSENSTALTDMEVGTGKTYPGFARLDFNVRNGNVCDGNIYRFYLKWPLPNRKTGGGAGITIKRIQDGQWEITTDKYGTASLFGQGGKAGQTLYYGDWRMPFKIILTQQ